jgi:omega-amidase
MDNISIGICQLKQGYDFEKNLSKALDMIDEAVSRGSDIVVLPEMFFTPYETASIRRAAPMASSATVALKEKAAGLGTYIVAGSMPAEADGRRFFNRSHVIDRNGQEVFRHNKIHLFDCNPPGGPKVKESEIIMPGDSLGTFDTPWGRSSVIICYDIRFSPLAQLLADEDIHLLFVPAAFSLATGDAHWKMLMRMRSVEIQSYVIGVQPAYNPDLKYVPYGHSMITSPWGDVVLDAGLDEVVEVVKLDLTQVESIRDRFPLLSHRRKDLYNTIWRKEQ